MGKFETRFVSGYIPELVFREMEGNRRYMLAGDRRVQEIDACRRLKITGEDGLREVITGDG